MRLFFKLILLSLCAIGNAFIAYTQDTLCLSLDSCQQWAKENYPLVKQYDLIEKSKNYSISNANQMFFPQIFLNGKATYQSDVPTINPSIFGNNLPVALSSFAFRKDQYQLQANVEQLIWQGINSLKTQKELVQVNAEVQKNQTNVLIYAIRNKINEIYLSIVLLDKEIDQLNIAKNTLQTTLHNISSLYKNQMANSSDMDMIEAEIINIDQQKIQMQSMRTTYLNMLSFFIKKTLPDSTTKLTIPDTNILLSNIDTTATHRPELAWYDAQIKIFDLQKKNINIGNSPRLSFYIQGGLGAPGLNYFNNNLAPYAIGGLKLIWNFSGLFTSKNDKALLDIQKNNVRIQKENFLFNNNLEIQKALEEINKIKMLVKSDETIVNLRTKIRKTADAKVQQGIMNTVDYIKIANDERLAIQNRILHEIQLVISLYNLKFIKNN